MFTSVQWCSFVFTYSQGLRQGLACSFVFVSSGMCSRGVRVAIFRVSVSCTSLTPSSGNRAFCNGRAFCNTPNRA